MSEFSFYSGKRVFVTGHTGFKGSWLTQWLVKCGAVVTGFALSPENENSFFDSLGLSQKINSVIGDIRDFNALDAAFTAVKPEVVFHLAAQPIVLESYKNPRYTYETNVMGTVNLLECVRKADTVQSLLNVTTDKVYKNSDDDKPFSEEDKLDGFDPYSNSKSCSELVTHSYFSSFLKDIGVAVSTARAGNVIGGGDDADNRIIPDCVRAAKKHETIVIRNPYSVRPYQHVLEPLSAYLDIAARQCSEHSLCGAYNIGPRLSDCITTGELADLFCSSWGDGASWESGCLSGPHEAAMLKLDCSKIEKALGRAPVTDISDAVRLTVDYYKRTMMSESAEKTVLEQIEEFEIKSRAARY